MYPLIRSTRTKHHFQFVRFLKVKVLNHASGKYNIEETSIRHKSYIDEPYGLNL